MNTPAITQVPTAKLSLHPLLERVLLMPDVADRLRRQKVKKPEHHAAADEITEDWTAFQQDIDERGILEPIKIVGTVIADGRHRWMAAKELGHKTVPCVQVTEPEARRIIESTVIARRHMTKGQRAYHAVVMHPEVSGNTKGTGMKARSDSVGTLTRGQLAKRYGVSPDLIDQACRLFERFEASKSLRDTHEKLVWAGFGLGGILAGIAGHEATHGRSIRTGHLASGLFRRLTAFGGSIATTWEKLASDEEMRQVVGEAMGTFLQKLPPELRAIARERLADDPAA